jgi:hypothetical protein
VDSPTLKDEAARSVELELPYRNPLLPIEQRVDDRLSCMTLEEKIAQMSVLGRIEEGITGDYDLDIWCRGWAWPQLHDV